MLRRSFHREQLEVKVMPAAAHTYVFVSLVLCLFLLAGVSHSEPQLAASSIRHAVQSWFDSRPSSVATIGSALPNS
jgi:hypothetical protein